MILSITQTGNNISEKQVPCMSLRQKTLHRYSILLKVKSIVITEVVQNLCCHGMFERVFQDPTNF